MNDRDDNRTRSFHKEPIENMFLTTIVILARGTGGQFLKVHQTILMCVLVWTEMEYISADRIFLFILSEKNCNIFSGSMVSSVGRAPVRRVGGHKLKPRLDQHSGSLNT